MARINKNNMKRSFEIISSQKDQFYTLFLESNGQSFKAFCNCQAGKNGILCKHSVTILNQDFSLLKSKEDEIDLLPILKYYQSHISRLFETLKNLEAEEANIKSAIKLEKSNLVKKMNTGFN
jgi:uncharacterized Zn finger protein